MNLLYLDRESNILIKFVSGDTDIYPVTDIVSLVVTSEMYAIETTNGFITEIRKSAVETITYKKLLTKS